MNLQKQQIRFGLCCLFKNENIKFRTTTAKYILSKSLTDGMNWISSICLHNSESLLETLKTLNEINIKSFRINSQFLPLKTHPEIAYEIEDLKDAEEIYSVLENCREFAIKNDIRLTFHPDQFVVLNSPRSEVVKNSIDEIEYQNELATLVNADVINIHGGGGYGDKKSALERFRQNFKYLSDSVKRRLTIENDDKIYTPEDLLPLCADLSIPLVYDVHHHRCLKDNLSVEEATIKAIKSWDREPLFHISSPKEGWNGPKINRHHDYININDFPEIWRNKKITIEVEAKFKELAVLKLKKELNHPIP